MPEKEYTPGLLEFIQQSPCIYYAAENMRVMFAEAGFTLLREDEEWDLQPGGAYVLLRRGAAVCAFVLPKEEPRAIRMVAAHGDSPAFKIKENPDMDVHGHWMLNTEPYGGAIYASWLDRPLSLAGQVYYVSEGELRSRLVNVDRDWMVIPSLAIHLNREVNKGAAYNPQVDMLPLAGQGKGDLRNFLAMELAVAPEDVLAYDLFLYVREQGRCCGLEEEYLLSPRLDDLSCGYLGAKSLLAAREREDFTQILPIFWLFDHEEVGSASPQGADSAFAQDVLGRIRQSLGWSRGRWRQLMEKSFFLSADNAHALHPARPEKMDPTNRALMGGGPVLKYSAARKYITDGAAGAKVRWLAQEAGVDFQVFFNRSDQAGGSTLGNLLLGHLSMEGADIGLPQLAMHSAVELLHRRDVESMGRFLEYFWHSCRI